MNTIDSTTFFLRAKLLSLLFFVLIASQLMSCKKSETEQADKADSDFKNISFSERDGKGFKGLFDVTFLEDADKKCSRGGVIYGFYNDSNQSGALEKDAEKVVSKFSNCYVDHELISDGLNSVISDEYIKFETKEEFRSYVESSSGESSNFFSVISADNISSDVFDIPYTSKLSVADVWSGLDHLYSGVWDLAIVAYSDMEQLPVFKVDVKNLASLKYSKNLEVLSFDGVKFSTSDLRSLAQIENLKSLRLSNVSLENPAALLPLIKNNPDIILQVSYVSKPSFAGLEKLETP